MLWMVRGNYVMDGDFFEGGHWGIGLVGRKRGREVCCGLYTLRDPQMLSSGFSIYIIWFGGWALYKFG